MIQLIAEDLDFKKVFYANQEFKCFLCHQPVWHEDPFIFVGDKKKICITCKEDIKENLI